MAEVSDQITSKSLLEIDAFLLEARNYLKRLESSHGSYGQDDRSIYSLTQSNEIDATRLVMLAMW